MGLEKVTLKKMKIGITGGIGSGKTFICNIITKMGFPVFYSDLEAKWLMENDEALITELKELIGDEAYNKEQKINKQIIANFIFKNPNNRFKINDLVHPKVFDYFNNWCLQYDATTLLFNESALLFETGSYKRFDKTILITAPFETRVSRIKSRDNLSDVEIQNRIQSQLPDEEKIKLADYVINNTDDELLLPKIASTIQQLIL